MQLIQKNPQVLEQKEKLMYQFTDLVYSYEWNSPNSNKRWWKGMEEEFVELRKRIDAVVSANEGRERFNLSELTQQRNKLNREISVLKKATPQN